MTILKRSISDFPPVTVPKESIWTLSGSAIPMEYDICTKTLEHKPPATRDLATHLAAYAALLSTLLGSFPEKAPPP